MPTDIDQAKHHFRNLVWRQMDVHGAGRTGSVHGKIPNFRGAELAARRLAAVERWRGAGVVKANPDKAQAEVRRDVLATGRLLYMAVPRLATVEPFYRLDPTLLGAPYEEAVTGKGAAEHAPRVGVDRMRPVDAIVCGSVAVDPSGTRIGKGAGYSDIEVALLAEAGLIGPGTLIVTTVHPLQVLDEELPETGHDFSVDLIVTPEETITCPRPRRPTGVVWEDLTEEKITAIPALQTMREQRGNGRL